MSLLHINHVQFSSVEFVRCERGLRLPCVDCRQHAKMISSYFYIGGVEAAMLAGCKLSRKLMTTLQMNSLPSDQLMLLYYKSLMDSSVSILIDIQIVV